MKKKLLFAVATGLFVVATIFNMNLLQVGSNGDVFLKSIAVMAQAQGESGGGGGYSCTATTSCGSGSTNYVSCTGVIECKRNFSSVECDGRKTSC